MKYICYTLILLYVIQIVLTIRGIRIFKKGGKK